MWNPKNENKQNTSMVNSCLPIRYFRSVFGQYFTVITVPILKENSVGTFGTVDTKKYVIYSKLYMTPRYF